MNYLDAYLKHIKDNGNLDLADAVKCTVDAIVPEYISNFSYTEHVVSLLLGNVQSGKTSHMFGVVSAAADEGFGIFVLLTTDNILLQQQTLQRAIRDLNGFCICDENDYVKFTANGMEKPTLIVLKKNGSILKQWQKNFADTGFCLGNPLFIVDDEADAASLNTLVNRGRQSTINKALEAIKKTTSSSIYMQVTGTPQSIILQRSDSGWHPYFIHYFEPGKGYLGGDFFFSNNESKNIVLTDNEEAAEILRDDEFPENKLRFALLIHLVSSAQTFLSGGSVSNFIIHPSVKTNQHSKFAEKIGEYINDLNFAVSEQEKLDGLKSAYDYLSETKADMKPFKEITAFIEDCLKNDKFKVLVLNSDSEYVENSAYEKGINIIVGGNSLGRGVTFPALNTIYYSRLAKSPQADTMWQHSRMFGYDRDRELIRVFMPPILYKLFSDINTTNNSIISQLKKGEFRPEVKLYYPKGLKPTRNAVIEKKSLVLLSGGVNYFPFYPDNKDIAKLDTMLSSFADGEYQVNLNFIKKILGEMVSNSDDFDVKTFIALVDIYRSENPMSQGEIIVRRNRDISKGTGTLLSPTDRKIGERYADVVTLTLYKVTGRKGWDGRQIWIPNVKFPGDTVYYNI